MPTVFDAEEKSLGEIARETRALADRVRAGTITPPELGGARSPSPTSGCTASRASPQSSTRRRRRSCRSARWQPRAVVRDGEVLARNTMTVTLACDHRILYGADAAHSSARIRELLEAPAALTL